ncbi:hypothetical protein [uncultured Mediterranean phage uvMED]|nr:hypothetical protein [uncultured Mediterranean phage uvMED]
MASKFGGVPINEPIEQPLQNDEGLSSSKFGGVNANEPSFIQNQQQEKAGFGTNLYRTVGGALRDVASGTLDVMAFKEKFSPIELGKAYAQAKASGDSSISNILETALQQDNPLNIAAQSIPKVKEPDYFGGSLVRDFTGFAIPGAAVSKVAAPIKAVTTGQKLLKGAATGSVAEQFAFSPYEERISNIIQDNPSLQNSITEYLQADPNDNEAEARLKMAVEGSAIGIPFDSLMRVIAKGYSKIKTNKITEEVDTFVGPKDTFVGPKSKFGGVPVTPKVETPVTPEVVTPKVEASKKKPHPNKIPEVLVKPKQPKGIKRVSSLLKESIPVNDPKLEEIARAMGTSPKRLSNYYKTKKAPESVSGTGEVRVQSDALETLTEKLNELQMAPLVGKKGFINQKGVNDFGQDDALQILEKNPPLPEYAAKYDEYLDKLNKYESNINILEGAGIDPKIFRGKTDEEVLDVVSQINEIEGMTGARVPDSFAAQFQDQPSESFYKEQDALADEFVALEESKISPKFIEEVDATPPDFAGNINLNKIDSPDKVKNVIDEIAQNNDDFMEARRGVVKFGTDGEELKALAKETGLTENELINRKSGTAFNAETAYAARVLNIESVTDLTRLAKKAQGTNATAEDMFAFEEALSRQVAIQEQIAGITAEAGRTLRSFRETVASAEVLKSRAIRDYIQAKGGGEKIEEMAAFISNLDTPEQVAKFTKDALKPKFKDKLQELWINSLLSSPSTHIVNVVSNGIVAATRMPEYAVASLLGAGRKGSDKVSFTETGGRIYGSMYGFLDGMRAFKNALIDPKSVDDPLTKLELQRQNSISGIKGEVVRLPGRFLTAEDQLFKSVGYRQELWGQAIRKAKSEGKGIKRAYEIMDDPAKNFPDIELKARDTARYQTFTNPLGPTGQSVQNIIQNHPWTRYIAPFVRTPVNIVKYAGQRTPLGVFAKSYKEAIKKGGAEADLARARVIVGSTAMASISMLANDGLVTGRGPADYRERSILRETGWQPYSILVGDTYYAYNRFEPVGILFGLAADWTDIYKYTNEKISKEEELEYTELASMLAASFSENITNKTFLTGVSDFINVMFNPDRYGEKSIQRFLSSFVPTASYYVRKNNDPLIRDAQSTMDAFYNRIPGLSTELPARRNVFGEERRFQEGFAPNFLGNIGKTFSPVSKSTITNDVVFNELARLKITPSIPKRTIGGVDLSSKQYENLFKEMITLDTKNKIKSLIQQPYYNNLLESQKIDEIKNIIQADQKTAREFTEIKNPEIITKQVENLMKQLSQ